VWFRTKIDHGAPVRDAVEAFCRSLAECEVRETLYMIRGCYGSVLSERGAQGAENSVLFADVSRRTRTFGCFLRCNRSRP
jgi:hypothetical protein